MEYMIKRVDGEFVELPPDANDCSVFQPSGFQSSLVDGYEVCAVRIDGCVLSFSIEPPGIQVVLEEGDLSEERATEFLEALARELERGTSQTLSVVRYA